MSEDSWPQERLFKLYDGFMATVLLAKLEKSLLDFEHGSEPEGKEHEGYAQRRAEERKGVQEATWKPTEPRDQADPARAGAHGEGHVRPLLQELGTDDPRLPRI